MPNNEFGDFQTPIQLARKCLSLLSADGNRRILEPTCGSGAFLHAASDLFPDSERLGIEIQPDHAAHAAKFGNILNGNVFKMHVLKDIDWKTDQPLLVVGNPPWVTSAELNRMDSTNLPDKENFKGAKGIDALLGSSNFDVCEYIILKLLNELSADRFVLGMLCKTHVARSVIAYASESGIPVANSSIHRIDAKRWFNAGVDACWFMVEVDPRGPRNYTTAAFETLEDNNEAPPRFGIVDGKMVANVDKYQAVRVADGHGPYEWRSGLKHDASAVFELEATPHPVTKSGERLDLEAEYVFPFLKCTDIRRGRHTTLSKWVIVPQPTFGAETAQLEHIAPNLWNYLVANGEALDARKSSIYRNRPRFTVFGHGPYTYAPYKIAISGLHKEPVFRFVSPINGKPVVLDDTCYFLAFEDPAEALVVWAALCSPASVDLIESFVFWDSKRPITKKLLARIDLNRLPIDRDLVIKTAMEEATAQDLDLSVESANAVLAQFGGEPEAMLF